MLDLAIGSLEVGLMILTAIAFYLVADLLRELKEAREYVRKQNEINRQYQGKWP